MTTIKKIQIRRGRYAGTYDIGGSGEAVGPGSIGTREIENESVMLEDLNDEVRDQLAGGNLSESDLEEIFYPTKGE